MPNITSSSPKSSETTQRTSSTLAPKPEDKKHSSSTNKTENVIVSYCGETYDVSDFIVEHPGGEESIRKYHNKDITAAFLRVHSDSQSAKDVLNKYKVNSSTQKQSVKYQDEGELMYPKFVDKKLYFNDFTIDLTKGYLYQIKSITKQQYEEIISYPVLVNFYVPIFDSKFLDFFSNSMWYHILFFWSIAITFIARAGLTYDYGDGSSIFDGYLKYASDSFSVAAVAAFIIAGFCIWSLMEYSLHRFFFHMESYIPDHYLFRQLSFLIHGIHHAMPMDSGRLVFPPVLGVIFYYILSTPIYFLIPGNAGRLFVVGIALGYLHYDMIHYSLHHSKQISIMYAKEKTNHFKHHYVDDTKGFGISNYFWDKVFNTLSL